MAIFLDSVSSPQSLLPSSSANGAEELDIGKIKKAAESALYRLLYIKISLGSQSYLRSLKVIELTLNLGLTVIFSKSEYFTIKYFMTAFCIWGVLKNIFSDLALNNIKRKQDLYQYQQQINEYNKQKDFLYEKGYDLLGVESLGDMSKAFEEGILHEGLSAKQIDFLKKYVKYYQDLSYSNALKSFIYSTVHLTLFCLSVHLIKTYGKPWVENLLEDYKDSKYEDEVCYIIWGNLRKLSIFYNWRRNFQSMKEGFDKPTSNQMLFQVVRLAFVSLIWTSCFNLSMTHFRDGLLHVLEAQKHLENI